jgi:hypothetical protein
MATQAFSLYNYTHIYVFVQQVSLSGVNYD